MGKKFYLLFVLLYSGLLIGLQQGYAQKSGKKKQWKSENHKMSGFTGKSTKFGKMKLYNGFGINISAMNYFGDLAPSAGKTSFDPKYTRPQIGATYMRRMGSRFALRAAFVWGRIQGDDNISANPADNNARFRYVRNLSFRNDIEELSVVSIVDLFENRGNYLRRVNITPYVFGGVAFFHHNPKAKGSKGTKYENQWIALQPLGTEGQGTPGHKAKYSLIQFAIPFGAGIRYRLNNSLDLGFEVGFRYTFTGYLDDVSGNYADPKVFTGPNAAISSAFADRSNEAYAASSDLIRNKSVVDGVLQGSDGFSVYAPGSKRGGAKNDTYVVTGFHITYVFVSGGKKNAKFR